MKKSHESEGELEDIYGKVWGGRKGQMLELNCNL